MIFLIIIGVIILITMLSLAYQIGYAAGSRSVLKQVPWKQPAPCRARCFPPGCWDYPECDHRF